MQVAFSFKGIQVFKPVKENPDLHVPIQNLVEASQMQFKKYVKCIHLRLSTSTTSMLAKKGLAD